MITGLAVIFCRTQVLRFGIIVNLFKYAKALKETKGMHYDWSYGRVITICLPPHPPPPPSSSSSLSSDGRSRRPWQASSPVCEKWYGGRPFLVWSSYKTAVLWPRRNYLKWRKRRGAHITAWSYSMTPGLGAGGKEVYRNHTQANMFNRREPREEGWEQSFHSSHAKGEVDV